MTEKIPIVTVSVATYNSSKFVLETLESIKAQTYPNLILQICDDCSTDHTITLCENWIEENKDRFVKTKIIVPEHNTGVSGNSNRAWDACETEYYKGIAGDDLLLPNCIEDNMLFVKEHPEAVFVFSKIECFGADEEQNKKMEAQFDYSKFEWTPDNQIKYILSFNNFIPASSAFVNIKRVRELGIRHDERIPQLEDMPKWIIVLRAGLKLFFMDNVTVRYRISESGLSTAKMHSPRFQRSAKLFWYYYCIEERLKEDKEITVRREVDDYMWLYEFMYSIVNSKAYKLYVTIGSFLQKLGVKL